MEIIIRLQSLNSVIFIERTPIMIDSADILLLLFGQCIVLARPYVNTHWFSQLARAGTKPKSDFSQELLLWRASVFLAWLQSLSNFRVYWLWNENEMNRALGHLCAHIG